MRRQKLFKVKITALVLCVSSGCANLHSVMIGERRLPPSGGRDFDVKVSETGFNVKEATSVVQAIGGKNSGAGKAAKTVNELYDLVSFGPVTGNPVMDTKYADSIGEQASNSCAPEKTIGVVSIRETMKYPVISGEIVKIGGQCK
ncbi:MAG: hypothetical protein KGP28_11550 [Bdellovibrionales bacterium]|nr:hypothetical protein [Bdellovibrionales bacterium]